MTTETPISNMAVYSAKPTLRIDSREHDRVNNLLFSMKMKEQEGGMSCIELRFSNWASLPEGDADFAFEDGEIINLGSSLEVYSGDENDSQEIFRGTVTAIEAEFDGESPPEMIVLAEDKFQLARMERRTMVHEDTTISDIAQSLAGRLSLTPVISGFSDNIGTWVQLNESDLSFVRRLLTIYDGDMQVVGDELHVSPKEDVDRGNLTLELNSRLKRVRLTADLAHQVTEIMISGWDPINGRDVRAGSSGSNLGPGQGSTGAQLLQGALNERKHRISHVAVTTDSEAQALADAAFDCRARKFVVLAGTAEGDPALRVGTVVDIEGVGARFENSYYVVSAVHLWDVIHGYRTNFQAECAFWRDH